MNEQSTPPANHSILPAKRRRGRPRKDGGIPQRGSCPAPSQQPTPSPEVVKRTLQPLEVNQTSNGVESNMVGKMVTGVIDGFFDAGYFLTIRVENDTTLLRGVVFRPGRFAPISASNDVAPQAKMYHRKDIPVPPSPTIPQVETQVNQPPTVPPPDPFSLQMTNTPFVHQSHDQRFQIQTQSDHRPENLRTVEHDDVMQVFEISPPQSQVPNEEAGHDELILSGSDHNRNPTGDPGSQSDMKNGLVIPNGDPGSLEAPLRGEYEEHLINQRDHNSEQKSQKVGDTGVAQNGKLGVMDDLVERNDCTKNNEALHGSLKEFSTMEERTGKILTLGIGGSNNDRGNPDFLVPRPDNNIESPKETHH
ncbi:unnamed protein product [Cuscuta epithymum]|uniref:AT hook motif-containing protein n=1 Tax=Cuscuta epithymum TaxID=186058 RepID=A0AAV0D858_9ASTE|nr:unnamed protein product [Cuscuta epithymum]